MPLAAEDSLTGAPGDGLRQWLVPGCSCGIEWGIGGEFSDELTYLVWGCLKELECFSHFLLPLTSLRFFTKLYTVTSSEFMKFGAERTST